MARFSEVIKVRAERTYDVTFVKSWQSALKDAVRNRNTLVLAPEKLVKSLDLVDAATKLKNVSVVSLPDGENQKSLETLQRVHDVCGEVKLGRDGLIVGLGGGATTDLAGFAAATWLRGVEWKAIPTTVAGMVDAAIGGKTGINTRHGKNLVGSFYSPSGVIVDVRFLETLSTRDINAGLAEVVKCGFIADPSILSDLEKSLHVTASLIHKAISVKAKVVSADFKESYGREVLNYGHTLGHAIEKHEKYALRHGEAVSIGMVFAAELSGLVSGLKPKIIDQHRDILTSLDLPITYRTTEFDSLLKLMSGDKKVQKGKLRFVTLKGLGRTSRAENVPLRHLTKAYERISS